MTSSIITFQPVVMAGGSGTRLWPLSRSGYPKQFLVLSGKTSLFQQAIERLVRVGGEGLTPKPPLVIGNEEHRFLMLDQLRDIKLDAAAVLLEPVGRNTAPAMTLAALAAMAGGDDPVLVVTPADQTVADSAAFASALRSAVRAAADGTIVILGVVPDRPETGYGYIRTARPDTSEPAAAASDAVAVAEFVEKPDLSTAQRYLAEGGYFWNSGIFVLRASSWLAALDQLRPDIAQATRAAWGPRTNDGVFVRPDKTAFEAIPAQSVDYAVIEQCPVAGIALRMLPLAAGWNDLGAWDAVWQAGAKDVSGNSGVGDAMFEGSRDSLVHASSRLVSVVGLADVVVVETSDAVLVADRSSSQDVKAIVERLGREGRDEHRVHRKVHRPWGWYDSVDSGPRFQVKRILVKPGASLSLQKHHHRAEHWIVVSGTAEVTCGERKLLLTENQSTYIPLGEVHRLANPGKLPLEIIEVQSGSYLGEDDIVRFEDTYGRE
jgi:mannose-1-phosphate guanylyltransferase/mannose-6-phosphate isomerase